MIIDLQKAFMHGDAGPDDGGEDHGVNQCMPLRDTQWGVGLDLLIPQGFADLISNDQGKAFQVAAEENRVELERLIPHLEEKFMADRSRVGKIMNQVFRIRTLAR